MTAGRSGGELEPVQLRDEAASRRRWAPQRLHLGRRAPAASRTRRAPVGGVSAARIRRTPGRGCQPRSGDMPRARAPPAGVSPTTTMSRRPRRSGGALASASSSSWSGSESDRSRPRRPARAAVAELEGPDGTLSSSPAAGLASRSPRCRLRRKARARRSLHRLHLGRAGDRGGRKRRPHELRRCRPRDAASPRTRETRCHRRGGPRGRFRGATIERTPQTRAEVVAHHVDDHHVLARPWRAAQSRQSGLGGVGVASADDRALIGAVTLPTGGGERARATGWRSSRAACRTRAPYGGEMCSRAPLSRPDAEPSHSASSLRQMLAWKIFAGEDAPPAGADRAHVVSRGLAGSVANARRRGSARSTSVRWPHRRGGDPFVQRRQAGPRWPPDARA